MSFVQQEVFDDYRRLCEDKWGVRIVEKKTSRFMQVLAKILFFNKNFLNGYITTIGTTVYWPRADDLNSGDFSTLFHEAQHAYDYKKFPPWFVLSYLSPQILSLLSLLSFMALTGEYLWLAFILSIAFIAPLPSIFRTHWEMRGMSCGMAYKQWTVGKIHESTVQFGIDRFCGPDYYYMWPFKGSMKRKIARAEQMIKDGKLTEVQKETYEFLLERGLVV